MNKCSTATYNKTLNTQTFETETILLKNKIFLFFTSTNKRLQRMFLGNIVF
jgi:hypothetical protein